MSWREVLVNVNVFHQKINLCEFTLTHASTLEFLGSPKPPAYNLCFGSFLANLIINNAVANHIDTHIGWRLIRAGTCDFLHHGLEHRKSLNVAVVVNGNFAVSLKVIWIDDVVVAQICRSCLVGNVYGVLERKVPNGERLKLCITCADSTGVLVVELREADSKLARARTRCCYNYQRMRSLYVLVFTVALRRDDQVNIGGVALNGVVTVYSNAHVF